MKTLKDVGLSKSDVIGLRILAKEHIKQIEEYFQPDLAKTKTDWIKWFFNLDET